MIIIPVRDDNPNKEFDPKALVCSKIIGVSNGEYRIVNTGTLDASVMLCNSGNIYRASNGIKFCEDIFTMCTRSGTFSISAFRSSWKYPDIYINMYRIEGTMLFGILFIVGSRAVRYECKRQARGLEDIVEVYLCAEIVQSGSEDMLPCIMCYSKKTKRKYFRYGSKVVETEDYVLRSVSSKELGSIMRSMI